MLQRTLCLFALAAVFCGTSRAQCELQRLSLPTSNPINLFGWSVAIEGDLAVMGSPGTDAGCANDPMCNSGSALVYRRTSGVWALEATLTGSDTGREDLFGQNCSISGTRILVGAHYAGAGAAYVFVNSGGGWVEEQKLIGSDSLNTFHFGHSVVLDGDRALIGVRRDDFAGTETGSAFVFERVGGVWIEMAKLTASDAAAGDQFGRATAMDGDVILIGAHKHDGVGSGADEGAAYVYERNDGGTPANPLDDTGPETARLTSSQPLPGAHFGLAVGVQGSTLCVGAPWDTGPVPFSGKVYVFGRSGSSFVEISTISAPDGEGADRFGESLAIDGVSMMVGAPGEDDQGSDAGAAYHVQLSGGTWAATSKFTSSIPDAGGAMGQEMTVDLSGTTALTGSPYSHMDGTFAGGAYIVDLAGCLGDRYCTATANSTGAAGILTGSGSQLVSANALIIEAASLPQNAVGYLLVSQAPDFVPLAGGSSGNLCLGGDIGRYLPEIFNSGPSGSGSTTVNLIGVPSSVGPFTAAPGDSLYFQVWHRDAVSGQLTSNLTQPLNVKLY